MVEDVLHAAVDEGADRLRRPFPALLSTGTVGGLDVGIGVFALFVLLHLTDDNLVVAGIGFSVGFIALTVAGSELFTENFLVPIVAVAADRGPLTPLLRLWGGTLVFNLVGGWVVMALVVSAFPSLRPIAVDAGQHFVDIGIGWRSFSLAMLAGMIITLMTWMELVGGAGVRIVAAVIAGSLLAIGEMNHSIVASMEMFAGLIAGAPYGYVDWLVVLGWAVLGNMVGGIGLVTVLRMVQAGGQQDETDTSAPA